MEYVNLGKTELKVSRICLGCMSYGDPQRGQHSWVLDEEATARGISHRQIALARLLSKPAVAPPIVAATKPQHLEDAVAAIDVKLTDEEVWQLEELYLAHGVVGFE